MKKHVKNYDLQYLENKPKKINYKIIAGPPGAKLSSLQDHDLIYDAQDLKIRKLDTPENLKHFKISG